MCKKLAVATKDFSIVDLLADVDMNEMDLDSFNTSIASGAAHTLLRNVTPNITSTPKCAWSELGGPLRAPKKKLEDECCYSKGKINQHEIMTLVHWMLNLTLSACSLPRSNF